MKYNILATAFVASLLSLPTQASETTLSVQATIPPILSLVTPEGQPLGSATVTLPINEKTGEFESTSFAFMVRSNNRDMPFTFSNKGHDVPTLRNGSGHSVPLAVTLEKTDMVRDRLKRNFDDIYNNPTLTAAGADSKIFTLHIAPKTAAVVPAGNYKANFTFYVLQNP